MGNTTNIQQLQAQQRGQVAQAAPRNLFEMLASDGTRKKLGAVIDKVMTPERMLGLTANAIRATPKLAECNPASVIGAMMAAASLGLEPNTPLQQAFLIPYKKRAKTPEGWVDVFDCQFQIGARGFVTLAYRSGEVLRLEAQAVRRGDHFKHMQGSTAFLEYSIGLEGRHELLAAYCLTKMRGGDEMATVLPTDEIYKSRDRSETFKALIRGVQSASNDKERQKAQDKLDATPWVAFEDDMAAKTVIKKHAKRLPMSSGDPLYSGATLDERSGEGLDDPDALRQTLDMGDPTFADDGHGEEPPAVEEKKPETVPQQTVQGQHATQDAGNGAPMDWE